MLDAKRCRVHGSFLSIKKISEPIKRSKERSLPPLPVEQLVGVIRSEEEALLEQITDNLKLS